jgi:putative CocE/NonD family hydrolase
MGHDLRKGQYAGRRASGAALLSLAVLLSSWSTRTPAALQPQQPSSDLAQYIKSNYTKREVMIPMRDGVRLFTAIYAPKDGSQPYPVLLDRTPYTVTPYGLDSYKDSLGPSGRFAYEGYIFVYQDVRGQWMSEGDFVDVRPHIAKKTGPKDIDESSDTYDTIEWLLQNVPNHNGRVGMWGISYPGFYVSSGVIDSHPALKAVSPQAPVGDWFVGDDFHHNGAFFLAHAYNFYAAFGQPRHGPGFIAPKPFAHGTPDGYAFFLQMGTIKNGLALYRKQLGSSIPFMEEMAQHPHYDEFWKARRILDHLHNITPAVLTVGGWFDAEDLYGALNTYASIEQKNPGITNTIVMGPWFHGGWARSDGDRLGHARFGSKTAEYYRDRVELPFFSIYLKYCTDTCAVNLPEALMFETGSNQWRSYDAWPPKNVEQRPLYIEGNGRLSFSLPDTSDGADEYVSDPFKPVPFIETVDIGMTREYMTDDQRFASRRPDVLSYQTNVLAEDLTAAGPLQAELFVSTTGTDADFVVKLIDVYPDDARDAEPNPTNFRTAGYQMLVRGEPFRARFRNGFDRPEPIKPGEVTRIDFKLPDVNHTFQRGHRIMLQIQSTWFPLVDRNPQRFVPNIFMAGEGDFQKATHRVYRTKDRATNLTLSVIKR